MGLFVRLTRYVKVLLVANISIFLIDLLIGGNLKEYLGLCPNDAIFGLKIWQFATYMFVHSVTNPSHLFFNMLALFMFGGPIEEAMGSRKFVFYYFLCGLGAAVFVCLFSWNSLSIGASGAIFGLIVAFGMFYPDSVVLVFFIFPMKARNFVILFACLELFVTMTATNDSIAHFAHIGGLVTGYLYLKYYYRREEIVSVAKSYRKVVAQHKELSRKPELEEEDKFVQRKVDVILDKIRESGLESLSREEYDTLQSASRRLREKDEKIVDINQYRGKYK